MLRGKYGLSTSQWKDTDPVRSSPSRPPPSPDGEAGETGGTEFRAPTRDAQFEADCLEQLDAVFRFSIYLTGNEVDAEDLAQDAILQALRKSHLFRAGTDLKAWLFRIARNLYIDQLRRKKLAPQLADLADVPARGDPSHQGEELGPKLRQDPVAASAGKPDASPVELSSELEESLYARFGDEVRQFLTELPQNFRLALVLCDVEDMSYEEISETLACPIGTVRSRISRARQFLREKLFDYAKDLGFTRGTKEST